MEKPPQTAERLGTEQDVRKMFNLLYFLVDAYSLTLEVLFRHSFGSRYLGFNCLLGLFLLICVGGLVPQHNPALMTCYFWVVLVMMLGAKVRASNNEKNGLRIHSYWPGTSRLPQIGRNKEKRVGGFDEACVAGLLSWPLYYVDPPLSTALFLGAICLAIKAGTVKRYTHLRMRDLEDARLESEYLAASVRR